MAVVFSIAELWLNLKLLLNSIHKRYILIQSQMQELEALMSNYTDEINEVLIEESPSISKTRM